MNGNKSIVSIKYFKLQNIDDNVFEPIISRVNKLVYSSRVNNELLAVTNCKVLGNQENINNLSLINESYKNNDNICSMDKLGEFTELDFVYQSDEVQSHELNNPYDYYSYIDGSRIITIILQPEEISFSLVYNDGEEKSFEVSEMPDCYRLVLLSYLSNSSADIISKIHQQSDLPHLNLDKDIMTYNSMNELLSKKLYTDLIDVRNKCKLGHKLSSL